MVSGEVIAKLLQEEQEERKLARESTTRADALRKAAQELCPHNEYVGAPWVGEVCVICRKQKEWA